MLNIYGKPTTQEEALRFASTALADLAEVVSASEHNDPAAQKMIARVLPVVQDYIDAVKGDL